MKIEKTNPAVPTILFWVVGLAGLTLFALGLFQMFFEGLSSGISNTVLGAVAVLISIWIRRVGAHKP